MKNKQIQFFSGRGRGVRVQGLELAEGVSCLRKTTTWLSF